jgi:hypothetical protein
MPANLGIAGFVLGAILLLVAILGGKFEIFGAKVDGQVGFIPRVVALMAGIVFLAASPGQSFWKPIIDAEIAAQRTPAPSSTRAVPAPPAQRAQLELPPVPSKQQPQQAETVAILGQSGDPLVGRYRLVHDDFRGVPLLLDAEMQIDASGPGEYRVGTDAIRATGRFLYLAALRRFGRDFVYTLLSSSDPQAPIGMSQPLTMTFSAGILSVHFASGENDAWRHL